MKNIIKAAVLASVFVGPAHADFATNYTLDLWNTPVLDGGSVSFLDSTNGSVTQNDPNAVAVVLTSANDGGNDANQDITFNAFETVNVTFDWSFTTVDGSQWDPFGYILNDAFNQLSVNGGGQNQAGTASFVVSDGDVFGLRSNTIDGIFGSSATTVSNFAVSPVPLPSSLGLMGFAFGGLFLVKRRRKEELENNAIKI